MDELRTIHLHGILAEKFGDKHEFAINTAGEAIRALASNFKEFVSVIHEGNWTLVRGDVEKGQQLDVEDINHFKLGKGDLHILPAVEGGKNRGLMIAGAVLLGAALFFSFGMGVGLATPILGGLTTWGNIAILGGAMLLSGVTGMKAGETGKDGQSENSQESFTFSGPGNIYEQGSPVPLVYGQVITGGVLISGGIDVEEI
jgi:predicted phage tail protein